VFGLVMFDYDVVPSSPLTEALPGGGFGCYFFKKSKGGFDVSNAPFPVYGFR
jgi:hypothetical protein